MINVNDLTYTSLETITGFDYVTGNYMYTLDELQNFNLSQTQDSSDITGKGGRKLASLKRNKAIKISGSNGLVSGGLMEVQTGCSFENKATEVLWTDYLTVEGGTAATSWKAVGTQGAEIEDLYIKNNDSTLGTKLTQNAEVGKGTFTYNPETKTLTFSEDIQNGTEIVVYYKRKIQADVLTNESDKYSGKCRLFVDALAEDKCGKVYRVQFYIPKADFSGEFSIEMGDNQTVHSFEAESLSGACGSKGNKDFLWTYTIFGANTEDIA